MKTLRASLIALFFTLPVSAADAPDGKHWYRFFLLSGDKTESIVVSSPNPPAELAAALSGTSMLKVEDLLIPGSRTEDSVLSWRAPEDTRPKASVFINPRCVVYFRQLSGQPKLASAPAPAPSPTAAVDGNVRIETTQAVSTAPVRTP